ncbi:type III protein arginine methyltransferase [Fistulifera solaris]|uniref:Type III protein arginine methyltransferase n=1 Tax=Fistulifera solaris TaxID=1519565 RepID=A0A1Z5JG67_FISSO|nr:type III protein arginine methyltransferase [Fistulifera solaris]|eukprot:GAX12926.1 type III protein arginine methyltransferase [Fistulifera solaris]
MSEEIPEDLAKALEAARYNEFVRMSTTDEHGNKNDIVLLACLDEKHGGIEWKNLMGGKYSMNPTTQFFRTKRWVFPMLNDVARNEMYQKAIQSAVEKLKERVCKESEAINCTCRVLDIGCGTGLLGMLAARSFQETLKTCKVEVIAIEMDEEMASVAKQTIQDNNLSDVITVVEGHSCELPALSPKADLCVSELLESGLLGEGILPAVRDAWNRHLQDDAIMIPQRARVYAQLVSCKEGGQNWLKDFYGPHNDKIAKSFGNCQPLRWSMDSSGSNPLLDARCVQLPVHAKQLFETNELISLSDAVPVFAFDFASRDAAMVGIDGRRQSTAFSVKTKGKVTGVLLWWELDLWEDITYSCEPGKQPFQDHWHQCLQLLPDGIEMDAMPQDTISLEFSHNDERIFVEAIWKGELAESGMKDDRDSALISPLRAYQLNDNTRLNVFQTALEYSLAAHPNGKAARILDISDGGWGACLAALLGATNVISVESNSENLAMMAARIAQCGNGLPLTSDGVSAKFDVIPSRLENLTVGDLWGQPPDIIIADYYHMFEGWHLQESLNFYYKCRSLRRKNMISDQTLFLPSSFRIMACVIESEQLRSAYSRCGDEDESILGLDHSHLNSIAGDFTRYDVSLPLFWQFEHKKLTDDFLMDSFEMGANTPFDGVRVGAMEQFKRTGRVDAVVFWIEYDFPKAGWSISTSGKPYHQLVRMLPNPSIYIEESDLEDVVVCIDFFYGGLSPPLTHDCDVAINRMVPRRDSFDY